MMNLWATKSNTFHIKLLWLLFGQLLENLGHFLIQHLVILVPANKLKNPLLSHF